MNHPMFLSLSKRHLPLLLSLLSAIALLTISSYAVTLAKPQSREVEQVSPIHPTFPLLDRDGRNVLESGRAISTMKTCGACHDTAFIEQHSYHASVGLEDFGDPGERANGRPWDTSPGFFGKWNPILYRYLSPKGDALLDLGTAAWIQLFGARHVGGGPAVYSREGKPLTELENAPNDPETNVLDPESGEIISWDWQASGVVEMNCFLCHTPNPNNEARIQALHEGKFEWANTATLIGSGVVELIEGRYQYNPQAFSENGELVREFVHIQDPTNENCGLCHGLVHDNLETPLVTIGCYPEKWRTVTTGQIISPQRLSDTGMNLADKEQLARSWDIHAERLLKCTDCHYSLNNPMHYQESLEARPSYLTYDPRRLELGEYLYQPLHQFARGQSAQSSLAPEFKDTMRRCESCHNLETTHNWLPYKERHLNTVRCETCHIPKMYSPAFQQFDWTVLHADANPKTQCRGIEGPNNTINALIVGYQPALLPQQDMDGKMRIAPFNLIASWYWVYGDPPRPVRLIDLKAVWLQGENYHPEVLAVFDEDGSGALDDSELVINSPQKEALIARRLEQLGLENPRIVGEIQSYSINHNVTTGEWAIRDCQTCHAKDSRLTQPFQLSAYLPGNVMPSFVQDSNVVFNGDLYTSENGALYYRPSPQNQGIYLIGHQKIAWIDLGGTLLFAMTLLGVSIHGGLRYYVARRRSKPASERQTVYMYSIYERFWHWLQTFTILGLLLTGLIIHNPQVFGLFSFRGVVLVHNVLAGILLVNAALSLFYHLASGEIRKFIPRPQGLLDQAIAQALYYVKGIFRNDPHPFEKTPQRKFNPLQQVTYFAILNILLPLQGLTGLLMWGAQHFPELTTRLGGLPFLAPFHTLLAWFFASFIVLHVYLTTTAGPTPLSSIQSMMLGWEELEIHPATPEGIHPTTQEEAKA